MDKRLEQYFVRKYPNLFRDYLGDKRQTCMAWGCTCSNGWFYIMDEAFKKAERKGVYLDQVKEKFGTLRLYWHSERILSSEEYDEVSDIFNDAENKSTITCEVCGNKGKLRGQGWLITLCDECNKLRDGSRNKMEILSREVAGKIVKDLEEKNESKND